MYYPSIIYTHNFPVTNNQGVESPHVLQHPPSTTLHGKRRDGTAIHQAIEVHIFGPAQLVLLFSDLK